MKHWFILIYIILELMMFPNCASFWFYYTAVVNFYSFLAFNPPDHQN